MSTQDQTSKPASPWKRRLLWCLVLIVAILVSGELFARFYLGLGNPALLLADPKIEYLYKPNGTYERFGNTIHFNQWSMRSDDFPEHKSDPAEVRVLVIGDSVINGGAQTDQKELATSILQRELSAKLGKKVIVGNISAGSWGPPNQLAYMEKFGWFDADAVVIVWSSHDLEDAPTYQSLVGVSADFPNRPPMCALQDAIQRYLPRYVPALAKSAPPGKQLSPAERRSTCESAIKSLHSLARQQEIPVIVALLPERLEGQDSRRLGDFRSLLASLKCPPVELGDAFRQSMNSGIEPYRDNLHPNSVGQQLIATALLEPITRAVAGR